MSFAAEDDPHATALDDEHRVPAVALPEDHRAPGGVELVTLHRGERRIHGGHVPLRSRAVAVDRAGRELVVGRARLPARYDRGSMLLRRRYAFESTVWTPRRNCGTALTAMVTSAPIWITTSAGTGSDTPPSTRILPSRLTGHHSMGTALLARPASSRLPEPIATRSPVSMSVATTRHGSAS